MPHFETGNMWDAWERADLFLITTNAIIKRNGELVMGRGIALEANKRDPQIALYFGNALADVEIHQSNNLDFGLVIPPLWPQRKEGMFQVKTHWRDNADIELIRMSTEMLVAWSTTFATMKVHLNYPGIGNGRLEKAMVKPIIMRLPSNVTIWEKA